MTGHALRKHRLNKQAPLLKRWAKLVGSNAWVGTAIMIDVALYRRRNSCLYISLAPCAASRGRQDVCSHPRFGDGKLGSRETKLQYHAGGECQSQD